jgi:DNA-binding transcriptional ArsR family regulator
MADETTPRKTLRAVAHPLRLQILSLLTGAELSAAEVARELDITHANASYHLRVLLDAGALVVAGEERIRGGVAKRYRHPWDQMPVDKDSDEDRRLYIRAVAEELVRRYAARQEGPPPAVLTDAEMWVTPEVWDKVLEHVREASQLIHAQARPARTTGTIHVNLTAAAFRMREDR